MNCITNYRAVTWSVFRHLQKLSSTKIPFCKCVDLKEFSTKSVASKSCWPNSLGLDFDLTHRDFELLRNRLMGSLLTSCNNINYVQKRFKSMKGQGRSGKKIQKVKKETSKRDDDDESDDEDEIEVSDVIQDTEIPGEDDLTLPQNYKHRTIYVNTIRADSLISSGLSFSRNRTDEVFYSSLLRLNGEKLLKKSRKVSVGDYVDFIVKKDEEKLKVQRVKLVKINPEKTKKDKYVLTLRIWKGPFDVEVTEEKKKFEPRKF